MGELRVVGKSSTATYGERIEGELRLTWSRGDAGEEMCAERTFKEYVGRGWLAIGEAEGKKRQIFDFDPSLEKITLSPIMVGG